MKSRTSIIGVIIISLIAITSQARTPSQRGVVFGAEEWSPLYDYTSPQAEQQLKRLNTTGSNWVRILVTWFQDSVNTTTIYPIAKPSLLATATDAELEHVIKLAHSMGFKVMLSPIIDPNWSDKRNHRSGPEQTWRGLIGLHFNQSHWNTWFNNYNQFVIKYAKMAQLWGVEQFCIGAELNTPFSRPNDMRAVIKNIRSVYEGSLTAAVLYFQATSGKECEMGIECSIQWFDAIDKIGIDAYYHLNTSNDHATTDEIVQAWQAHVPLLQNLHQRWNKPIIFVEIGYTSAYNSHAHPDHMELIAYDDCSVWALCVFLQEQANSYEAAFKVFWNLDWFDGMFWWLWRTDPHDGHTADSGFSPVGKPSEKILQRYYSRNSQSNDSVF
jgi:hypothetical protein